MEEIVMGARRFYYSAALFLVAFFLIGSQCATLPKNGKPDSGSLFDRALSDLKNHRFEEAKFGFKQVYTSNPASERADDALFRLGYISCVQKKYSEGKGYFDELVKKYPKSEWSFDAKIWFELLDAYSKTSAELDDVKTKLGSPKQPDNQSKTDNEASKKIEELQKEIEKLREENNRLREIIESGD
jgi:outer membrane protein assembly factor BamD (BamD/ComL family)